MKILLTGSYNPNTIAYYYYKYLLESGVSVVNFPTFDKVDNYNKIFLNKVSFKLNPNLCYRKINKELKEAVIKFNPNFLWVFKGMEILPEFLSWAKAQRIILVNYNPDNPYIFSGKGSGNKNIIKNLKYYDIHFTYNNEILQQLKSETRKQVYFLPFGHDVSEKLFQEIQKENEIIEACFLGNADNYRAGIIHELNMRGIVFNLYGKDWDKYSYLKSNKIFGQVEGIDYYKTLYKYRVQLNIMRVHNLNSHNMRTFEIPGSGGIQLAPYTVEQATFFEEGKEIFLYKNFDECAQLINKLLTENKTVTDLIRKNARKRCINSGYSYADQTKIVCKILKEYSGN